ncbi:hypothetical protein ACNKHK_19470 [Shigella flexneri]
MLENCSARLTKLGENQDITFEVSRRTMKPPAKVFDGEAFVLGI